MGEESDDKGLDAAMHGRGEEDGGFGEVEGLAKGTVSLSAAAAGEDGVENVFAGIVTHVVDIVLTLLPC